MNTARRFWVGVICLAAAGLFTLLGAAYSQEAKAAGPKDKAREKCDPGFLKNKTAQYIKDKQYNECADYIKSLIAKKDCLSCAGNYYLEFTRYTQLKGLEDAQSWDEYFSKGNDYRNDINTYGQKAIECTSSKDALNIYARLMLWRLHKDQQDSFAPEALNQLVSAAQDYSKDASSDIAVIKEAADELRSYSEKAKSRQLYKLYADKLVATSKDSGELKSAAGQFYKEGNLELAETIYDAFIEKITADKTLAKDKILPLLISIAKQFSAQSDTAKDMFYAEKVFKDIKELGGADAFDETLLYLRAYNLEKSQEYKQAKDIYLELIARFPKNAHRAEINYKLGIIYTYILRDIKSGSESFEKLSQEETLSPEVVSGLYQLGLLSQWANDLDKAKQYYTNLLDLAKENFPEVLAQAKARLKEIEDKKALDYNLKTFLDLSLKEEAASSGMTKVDLNSLPFISKQGEKILYSSTAFAGESGCMSVQIQYLWSGDMGESALPLDDKSSFETAYTDKGTKVVNVVAMTPSGVIGYALDIVDIN